MSSGSGFATHTQYCQTFCISCTLVGSTSRESIPRLFNEGRTIMTTRCAPACSHALPVKPQGVMVRGIEAWAGSRDLWNLEFRRWGSSGVSEVGVFRALQPNDNCWSFRCSWSSACQCCSNYIFILNLTPGFNGLGKDTCKTICKNI